MSVIGLDDERIAAGFRNAEAESRFWAEHRDELTREYPDQFIAVANGAVAATAADLQQLLYALRAKQIDPSRVWVRFMALRPHEMIL